MSNVKKILQFLSVFLLCTIAYASDVTSVTRETVVESPSQQHAEHEFWNRTNKILLSSHAGLEALDFGITHHNLAGGGTEMDSMAKALCESGTAGQIVFFGGRTAGVVAISYLLHRIHQHKMERAFIVYASGDSLYGISYSFAHR
ncbi:MAG TPA: hypothetical protein VFA74_11090 [Terriglobales bacterium]|nr:hypothetical protein [Terriglobales bacterium]